MKPWKNSERTLAKFPFDRAYITILNRESKNKSDVMFSNIARWRTPLSKPELELCRFILDETGEHRDELLQFIVAESDHDRPVWRKPPENVLSGGK